MAIPSRVRACDPRSDEELIAAANAGDAAAFEAIYHRYRAWVLRVAYRLTHDREESLDVLQETFLYLLKKFPGFQLTARMTTFLFPVVRNIAIARVRKRDRERGPAPGHETMSDSLPTATSSRPVHGGFEDDLTSVLAGLPDAQRDVLLMRFVDDMSLEEIAVALAVPLGTIKSRLHGAIARLRADPRVQRYFLD